MKVCASCKLEKPRTEFGPKTQQKDGLYPYCRPCANRKAKESSTPERRARKHEYDLARYAKKKPEILEKQRLYYESHREQARIYVEAWKANNPEKRRAIAQSYKSRRRAVESAGMSGKEMFDWTKAQAKVCFWCNVDCSAKFEVDHFQPLAKGGTHTKDNLVIACPPCNRRKSATLPEVFVERLLAANDDREDKAA